MITAFLVVLMILDLVLLGAVIVISKKRLDDVEIIKEVTKERQMLTEQKSSIAEELELARQKNKEILEKVTRIAAEMEQEVKQGRDTLTKELEAIVQSLSTKFELPLFELSKKQAAIENLLRKLTHEKTILQKTIFRAEKLTSFFSKKIPYEDVLQEIEDKKYSDARQLLAQGMNPDQIATELGLSVSEVKLLASF